MLDNSSKSKGLSCFSSVWFSLLVVLHSYIKLVKPTNLNHLLFTTVTTQEPLWNFRWGDSINACYGVIILFIQHIYCMFSLPSLFLDKILLLLAHCKYFWKRIVSDHLWCFDVLLYWYISFVINMALMTIGLIFLLPIIAHVLLYSKYALLVKYSWIASLIPWWILRYLL